METSYLSEQEKTICAACETSASSDDSFCTTCGYPLQGSEQEQKNFLSIREARMLDLEEKAKSIKGAATALYLVGGLTVVMGLVYGYTATESEKSSLLVTNLILAAIYIGLGFWSKKKPMAAIVTGLSLFLLVNILNAILEPVTMIQGIIMKVIIVGAFIKAIKAIVEAEKIRKEHNLD